MNIDNNKYELIDNYLSGSLHKDDLDKFKAYMQSDADLRQEVTIAAELQESADFNTQELQLRQTLAQVHKDHAPKSFVWKYLLMAGLLAITSFILLKFFAPSLNQSEPIHLAANYSEIEPLSLITKGETKEVDIRKMQILYNKKKFTKALPLMAAYLASRPDDLDVLLAEGISLSEIGNYKEAEESFSKIESLGPRVKKYLWYRALNQLKQEDSVSAKQTLNEIISKQYYNHEKAQALMNSIK